MTSNENLPSAGKMGRAGNGTRRGIAVRLFLTCWLVYLLHSSPFVARELYLTISLAEKHSVRVDEYVDLHSDLFFIPGRGGFMGGNPGVSILSAIPYWLSLPIANRVAPVRPPPAGEKISAVYDEQRANRRAFYQKVRERGLDKHLGFAAMVTSVLFMAPLAAVSAVLMFWLLERFGFSPKLSLWLTLLYAFGTPIFFRATPLSPNLAVTVFGLFSFAVLCSSWERRADRPALRLFTAGLLAGWTIVVDYSGVVAVGVLGLFALTDLMKQGSFWTALRKSVWFLAGAAGPVAFLFYYQWYCYGNPWLPVQYHQPAAKYIGYLTERGVGWPMPAALWGLLFDPLYGLLVFAPIFGLALYHPVLIWRRKNRVPARVAWFCWILFLFLWVFFSCIQYTLRHQWQDGVRYLVPAVPLLFLLVADVVAQMPRALAYLVAFAAVFEIWCLAMVREDPLESILRVLFRGPELPWLTALIKTAPQYAPWLGGGSTPLVLFIIFGLLIWGIWKIRDPWRALDSERNGS
jgi:hypothetical protein